MFGRFTRESVAEAALEASLRLLDAQRVGRRAVRVPSPRVEPGDTEKRTRDEGGDAEVSPYAQGASLQQRVPVSAPE